MVGKVYVRDLEILSNMQVELNQFNSGTLKVLDDVARNIVNIKEHLSTRVTYWTAELRRRETALRACQSDNDENRNCSSQSAAVREANVALEKLHRLSTRLEQAIGEYQPHSNHLRNALNGKISKAKGDLQRSIEKYQQYLNQTAHSSGTLASSSNPRDIEKINSTNATTSKPGITWAEKETILRKIDKGISISSEEFQKLSQPISDLQAMTLAVDNSWVEQLLDSQQFYEATRDSREAQDLKDAILATLKTINYWRSKS